MEAKGYINLKVLNSPEFRELEFEIREKARKLGKKAELKEALQAEGKKTLGCFDSVEELLSFKEKLIAKGILGSPQGETPPPVPPTPPSPPSPPPFDPSSTESRKSPEFKELLDRISIEVAKNQKEEELEEVLEDEDLLSLGHCESLARLKDLQEKLIAKGISQDPNAPPQPRADNISQLSQFEALCIKIMDMVTKRDKKEELMEALDEEGKPSLAALGSLKSLVTFGNKLIERGIIVGPIEVGGKKFFVPSNSEREFFSYPFSFSSEKVTNSKGIEHSLDFQETEGEKEEVFDDLTRGQIVKQEYKSPGDFFHKGEKNQKDNTPLCSLPSELKKPEGEKSDEEKEKTRLERE